MKNKELRDLLSKWEDDKEVYIHVNNELLDIKHVYTEHIGWEHTYTKENYVEPINAIILY